MSDFCENCNPHSSYHTTAVGECLVGIAFAETCKLTLFTLSKIFISLKNEMRVYCMTNRQLSFVCRILLQNYQAGQWNKFSFYRPF